MDITDVAERRARAVFAEELERASAPALARMVLDGTDNSTGGTAAISAMKRVMAEQENAAWASLDRHPRARVIRALDSEWEYQQKWADTLSSGREPTADFGGGWRSIDEYITYLVGYSFELLRLGAFTSNPIEKLNFIRKVGALAVACMDTHGAPLRELPPE